SGENPGPARMLRERLSPGPELENDQGSQSRMSSSPGSIGRPPRVARCFLFAKMDERRAACAKPSTELFRRKFWRCSLAGSPGFQKLWPRGWRRLVIANNGQDDAGRELHIG